MKVKNNELGSKLFQLNQLKGIILNGDVNVAIVELKVQLKAKMAIVEEAIKAVIEPVCLKGEDGKPSIEHQQTEQGVYVAYKFPDTKTELECKEKINEIDSMETEFNISPSSLTKEVILGIRCTPDQTEALLMMIVEPTMVKA